MAVDRGNWGHDNGHCVSACPQLDNGAACPCLELATHNNLIGILNTSLYTACSDSFFV